jgi:NADH-quinone oxidoreductase subunit G
MTQAETQTVKMINITVDDKPVAVPQGTNLIEAAKLAGAKIPYYCYHPDLSIAGNCRMCQVEVTGIPKLMIGCHTTVTEGMQVKTHQSSQLVKDAQAATLEMILINHPLDCTVCDQSGHCKLQDYHFEYNARPSRFIEVKEEKVKAQPLGPNVILDGERCIMCTRCIRFCDEITGTSELGMLNRGDRSVITVNPDKELNNALSGSVVDLCPVGALTHRKWRFNTRIWYTKQTDSICPGCSRGCNVKVAVRDGEVVMVKARYHDQVNKSWLCDEGRYGFMRFLPKERVLQPRQSGVEISLEGVKSSLKTLNFSEQTLVLVSPDLLLEEYKLLSDFVSQHLPSAAVALAYRERSLTDVEKILIAPDYACNHKAAEKSGLVSGDLQATYEQALAKLKAGEVTQVLLFGERAILPEDLSAELLSSLSSVKFSLATLTDAQNKLLDAVKVTLPGRSILEKTGLMLNKQLRLQYAQAVIEAPQGTKTEVEWLSLIIEAFNKSALKFESERALTIHVLSQLPGCEDLTIKQIKAGGRILS